MSTSVDNLFVAGRNSYGVTCILDDAEAFLSSEWGLSIKPSSRFVVAPLRAIDTSVTNEDKWPVVSTMPILGHILQDDGGTNVCYDNTVKQMWGAFFANCAGRDARQLPTKVLLALVSRVILPILRFRWARRPFTFTLQWPWTQRAQTDRGGGISMGEGQGRG